MELTRAESGQAVGEMAALRFETGGDVRSTDYTTLRARLLSGGDAAAPVLPQVN